MQTKCWRRRNVFMFVGRVYMKEGVGVVFSCDDLYSEDER